MVVLGGVILLLTIDGFSLLMSQQCCEVGTEIIPSIHDANKI